MPMSQSRPAGSQRTKSVLRLLLVDRAMIGCSWSGSRTERRLVRTQLSSLSISPASLYLGPNHSTTAEEVATRACLCQFNLR